jgi:hypothetical protein
MRTSIPVAYLLTFSTYGTWLHGDARGSHHHRQTTYGVPGVAPSAALRAAEERHMRSPPAALDRAAREIAERVAAEVCEHRGWVLLAVNARTTHIRYVISAPTDPERVLLVLEAWTTRRLVEAELIPEGTKPWSRHGSTLYLWTLESCERAVWYVLYEQDEARPPG